MGCEATYKARSSAGSSGKSQIANRQSSSLSRPHRPRLVLDRHPDGVAPLGPRPVVVLDRVAEEALEHEPAVARPLADAAVRHDGPAAVDPRLGVQLLQLVRRL